jgi:hypothetical protein
VWESRTPPVLFKKALIIYCKWSGLFFSNVIGDRQLDIEIHALILHNTHP